MNALVQKQCGFYLVCIIFDRFVCVLWLWKALALWIIPDSFLLNNLKDKGSRAKPKISEILSLPYSLHFISK